MKHLNRTKLHAIISVGILVATLEAAGELASTFDATLDGWNATPGATLSWEEANSNGYAEASFTNSSPWYFVAPSTWLGDWTDYRILKWDLVISSGDYAVSNANDIIVIEGANGTNLVWRGPSPYWEWTHYECPLEPAYFGVDQATFNGVIADVTAFKILGEYKNGNEEIGLDNILVSTNATTVQTALSSTFDVDMEGWRPYDDVTLSHVTTNGNPDGYLHGVDWVDGRSYRFASPLSWAGDWSAFNQLSFDLKFFNNDASSSEEEIVWLQGGSGEKLIYTGTGPSNDWTSFEVYLVPENFGVDQATFDRVMAYVTEVQILGEFRSGSEQEGLDNVVLSSETLVPIYTDLISTFDNDLEGWSTDGDGDSEWVADGGDPGGYHLGKDRANGPYWHFVSPSDWKGNWINFEWLQFKLKSVSGATFSERPMICLEGMNGIELWATNTVPFDSWTPYGLALTPEAFATNAVAFNSVISYVKQLRIYGEVGGGTDRAALDTFGLYQERPPVVWPGQVSTFNVDMEAWRKLNGITLNWESTGGNPDGFLRGSGDGSGLWHYVSPESWNGDWSGYKSLRFDHIILSGTNSEWDEPSFYIVGANGETLSWKGPEASNAWVRFEANLSPELFGVDQVAYDAVMERVVEVSIRGEYVNGSEVEGLDNVYLSAVPFSGGPPSAPVLAAGTSETEFSIWFLAESNVIYQLEANTNLIEGAGWEDVPGKSISGNGEPAVIEVDLILPVRHFRLRAN